MALPTAPAGVVFSYNGITFPVSIKTQIKEKPIESGDGRVIKYSTITINVSGYITMNEAGNLTTLDALMRTWRTSLQKNGKTLTYINKGYGVDLTINAVGGGGVRDVAMGPKAGEFTWTPMGGAPVGCFAASFNWSVSATIPECTSAHYIPASGIFSEISFTVAYAQDEAGLTTVTTTGTIEIPLSLQSNNTLSNNVDQFFRDAIAAVPNNFIRTAQRQISADRRTCTFTLTDKQIEVCYPNDVVLIDAEHRVRDMGSQSQWGVGVRWDCSLSGTVRMSPTAPKSLALTRFWNIVLDRIKQTRNTAGLNANGTPTGNNCVVTWPMLEMAETLFKNQSRFSVRYKILNGATLRNILQASAIWKGIPGTNFGVWAGSLSGNAQKQGGVLSPAPAFAPADEVIVDVCNTVADDVGGGDWGDGQSSPGREAALAADAALIAAAEPITFMEGVDGDAGGGDWGTPGALGFGGGTSISGPTGGTSSGTDSGVIVPSATGSWMAWTCSVQRQVDHHVIRHKPLSGTVTYDSLPFDPLNLAQTQNDTSKPGFKVSASVADIIQQTSSPSVTLLLTGSAIRLGYRANPPKLVSFGGTTPTLKRELVRETELSADGGLIVYRTDWELTYIINSIVDTVDLPANPMLGVEGQVG